MEIEDENDDNDDDNKNEPKRKRGKHVKHMGPGFGEQSITASKMPAEVEAEHMTPKKARQMVTSEKNRKTLAHQVLRVVSYLGFQIKNLTHCCTTGGENRFSLLTCQIT
jgi:hypothetical protein